MDKNRKASTAGVSMDKTKKLHMVAPMDRTKKLPADKTKKLSTVVSVDMTKKLSTVVPMDKTKKLSMVVPTVQTKKLSTGVTIDNLKKLSMIIPMDKNRKVSTVVPPPVDKTKKSPPEKKKKKKGGIAEKSKTDGRPKFRMTAKNKLEEAKHEKMLELAEELSLITHFDEEECLALLKAHEFMLDRGKFELATFRDFFHCAFDITSDLMLDLMFRAFDRDADGDVDQLEFVKGLSQMIRGDMDELTEFCYFVYDMNGDRSLGREELHQCLKGCLKSGYGMELDDIERAEDELVDLTMRKLDYNRDGIISFEDFQKAVKADPLMLVACGECLPSDEAISRFLYCITEDFRTFTGPLPGESWRKAMDGIVTRRSRRFSHFFSQRDSVEEPDPMLLLLIPEEPEENEGEEEEEEVLDDIQISHEEYAQ